MCVRLCERDRERERVCRCMYVSKKRERGKGEEIQKGGTEWRGKQRDIVRFRNKKELLPVIQYRQTDRQTFSSCNF